MDTHAKVIKELSANSDSPAVEAVLTLHQSLLKPVVDFIYVGEWYYDLALVALLSFAALFFVVLVRTYSLKHSSFNIASLKRQVVLFSSILMLVVGTKELMAVMGNDGNPIENAWLFLLGLAVFVFVTLKAIIKTTLLTTLFSYLVLSFVFVLYWFALSGVLILVQENFVAIAPFIAVLVVMKVMGKSRMDEWNKKCGSAETNSIGDVVSYSNHSMSYDDWCKRNPTIFESFIDGALQGLDGPKNKK